MMYRNIGTLLLSFALLLMYAQPAHSTVESDYLLNEAECEAQTVEVFSLHSQGIQVESLLDDDGLCDDAWTRSFEVVISLPPGVSVTCEEGGDNNCTPESVCDLL